MNILLCFFRWGGGRGARVNEFFSKNANLSFFILVGGWAGWPGWAGVGGGGGGG